jgi:hypothetical protein
MTPSNRQPPAAPARRSIVVGLAAGIVAAAAGAAWKFHLLGPHYPPTPYDDLLNQIADRAPAMMFGRAALKAMPGMSASLLATQLRRDGRKLSARATAEPGDAQIVEVAGWVVPQSVALYAALAAQA